MMTYSVFTNTGLALTQLCERDFEHFMTWINHDSVVRILKNVSDQKIIVLYDAHELMYVPSFLRDHSHDLSSNDIYLILIFNWKPIPPRPCTLARSSANPEHD